MFRKTGIAALLLTGIMLFASCSGNKPSSTGTTPPDNVTNPTETTEPLELPDIQFDSDIRIFVKGAEYSDELKPDEVESNLSNAVFSRNSKVQETYHVTFQFTQSLLAFNTDALNALQSGTDIYDIMQCHGRSAYSYAGFGLAVDWNTLPYINLDKPWWNASAREELTIAGKLPAMTGELGYSTLGGGTGTVFNKTLFNAKGISPEYFFDLVDEGEWTFDEFYKLAEDMKDDLNGDGVIDLTNDQLGYVTSHWGGPIQILYTTGSKIITRNQDGVPEYSFYNAKTVDIFERFFKLIRSDSAHCELSDDGSEMLKAWSTGRVALMQTSVNKLGTSYFLDSEVAFGLLPLPKYNKQVDKYYSVTDASSTLYVVPTTTPTDSHEMIGVVLEAMSYYGRQYILPAYYDKTLASRYVNDPESARMLDYIYAGCSYDLGYYDSDEFGQKFASIGYELAHNDKKTFTMYYRENIDAMNELIAKSYAKYAGTNP